MGERATPPRGERIDDESLEGLTKVAVAGLAVLQAAFTALGAANGSLGVVALNKPLLLAAGMVAIAGGFVLALWGLVTKRVARLRLLGGLGLVALAVLGTAYAAIAVPTRSSSPIVNIEIISGKPPLLRGEVKGNGIKRGTLFQIRADSLNVVNHQYKRVLPTLYHGVLGANASGEVEAKFEIPIDPSRYEAVSVAAWSDTSSPGACGFKNGTFSAPDVERVGCALVDIAGLNRR